MRKARVSEGEGKGISSSGCCMSCEAGGSVQVLGADGMLYQTTEDLLSVGHELNPSIEQFEASCFNGAPLPLPNCSESRRAACGR